VDLQERMQGAIPKATNPIIALGRYPLKKEDGTTNLSNLSCVLFLQ